MTIVIKIAKEYPDYEVHKITVSPVGATEKFMRISKACLDRVNNGSIQDYQVELIDE